MGGVGSVGGGVGMLVAVMGMICVGVGLVVWLIVLGCSSYCHFCARGCITCFWSGPHHAGEGTPYMTCCKAWQEVLLTCSAAS